VYISTQDIYVNKYTYTLTFTYTYISISTETRNTNRQDLYRCVCKYTYMYKRVSVSRFEIHNNMPQQLYICFLSYTCSSVSVPSTKMIAWQARTHKGYLYIYTCTYTNISTQIQNGIPYKVYPST
jgi:hypothetical protein